MLVRRTLDRIARRFPGGTAGNRNLTALLGAVLLVGILGELATLVLGLRQTLPVHIALGCRADPDRGAEARVDRVADDPLLHARLRVPGRGAAPAFPAGDRTAGRRFDDRIARERRRARRRGPAGYFFRAVHSASFAIFLLVVGIHVVAHLPKLRRFALADWASGRRANGHQIRRGLVAFVLVSAGAVSIAALQTAGPWVAAIHQEIAG